MHVHLVGSKGDYHVGDDSSMHIVKEHWAANGSHAYMVNVSAGQFKILKNLQ